MNAIEILIPVLGEGLAFVLLPILVILGILALSAVQLALELIGRVFSFSTQSKGKQTARAARTIRRLRRLTLILVVLGGGFVLLVNTVLFEESLRSLFSIVRGRTGISIRFQSAEGSWLSGRFTLNGVHLERRSGSLRASARRVRLHVPLRQLLRKPVRIELLSFDGLDASALRRQGTGRLKTPRARRPFEIRQIRMTDCRLTLNGVRKQKLFRVPLNVAELSSTNLHSARLMYGMLFNSRIQATLAGSRLTARRTPPSGALSRVDWSLTDLSLAAIKPLVGRRLDVVQSGRVTVSAISPSPGEPSAPRQLQITLALSKAVLQPKAVTGSLRWALMVFAGSPQSLNVGFQLQISPKTLKNHSPFRLPGLKSALMKSLLTLK